jgi:serine/threonine protein kinase
MSKSAFKEWYNLQSLSKAEATIHRHLMPALGAYLHGDIFFILQEEADFSLSDYLRGQGDKFDSQELWNQVRGLADGLDELHRLHKETKIAYHQDLKPANILVVKGTLKIADFGLLEFKPVLFDDTGNTGVISAHNTGYYTAPRHGKYTREDDIWSLACIVSELATSDIEGREGIVNYREARIGGGLSQDTPRFFLGQTVKPQVLTQHNKLQVIVQQWDTAGQVNEQLEFQKKFYITAFFTLLNSMFRHRHDSDRFLDTFGQITVPDAGQFSKAIEKLRKEAMPVRLLEEQINDASSPQIASGLAGDLVLSLENTLEEFRGSLNREHERISRSATSTDFKQFLANMQARQHSERCQRGLKRLAPIIEAFERFAQMLNEYCDSDIFMAFIWVRMFRSLSNS